MQRLLFALLVSCAVLTLAETVEPAEAQAPLRRKIVLMEYGAKMTPEALARSIADAAQRCWLADPQFAQLRLGRVEPVPTSGSGPPLEGWAVRFVEKSAKGRDATAVVSIGVLAQNGTRIVLLDHRRTEIDVTSRVDADVDRIYRGGMPC